MRIVIQSASEAGRVFELSKDVVALGRGSANDIVLTDLNASRNHCQIRREGSDWVVHDLGSLNGTRVNNEIITSRALQAGDRITIGQTELLFESSQPNAWVPEPERIEASQTAPFVSTSGSSGTVWLLGGGVLLLLIVGLIAALVFLNQAPPPTPPPVAQVLLPNSAITLTPVPAVTTPTAPTEAPRSATRAPGAPDINATFTPIPTRFPTWTPTVYYRAPELLLPIRGKNVDAGAPVSLSWSAVGALRPSEFYYVQISIAPEFGAQNLACEIRTRENYVTAPGNAAVCNDKWQASKDYHYYWRVQVARMGDRGENIPTSDSSPIWDFTWAP